MDWISSRILIVGKTYPSLSHLHNEVACTGGILSETKELIRLHPIPFRYLSGEQRFKDFQWIRADIVPDSKDPRPGTFRVRLPSITLDGAIESSDRAMRRKYIVECTSLFSSKEALEIAHDKLHSSLGIVQPKSVSRCWLQRRTDRERHEWEEKQRAIMSQGVLVGDEPMAVEFPPVKFMIDWTCTDESCRGHSMGLLQWGIHELYRGLAGDPDRDRKTVDKMESQMDVSTRDVFFFLGNFRAHQGEFGIMQVVSLPKARADDPSQGQLF